MECYESSSMSAVPGVNMHRAIGPNISDGSRAQQTLRSMESLDRFLQQEVSRTKNALLKKLNMKWKCKKHISTKARECEEYRAQRQAIARERARSMCGGLYLRTFGLTYWFTGRKQE